MTDPVPAVPAESEPPKRRWRTAGNALVALALLSPAVAWFLADPLTDGDATTETIFLLATGSAAALAAVLWVLLLSGWSKTAKAVTVAAGVAGVAALFGLFRVEVDGADADHRVHSPLRGDRGGPGGGVRGGEPGCDRRGHAAWRRRRSGGTGTLARRLAGAAGGEPGRGRAGRAARHRLVRRPAAGSLAAPGRAGVGRVRGRRRPLLHVGTAGGRRETVVCYRADDGAELWATGYPARFVRLAANGGDGPASTPLFHEGDVFSFGATGVATCCDGRTGELKWKRSLLGRCQHRLGPRVQPADRRREPRASAGGRGGAGLRCGRVEPRDRRDRLGERRQPRAATAPRSSPIWRTGGRSSPSRRTACGA